MPRQTKAKDGVAKKIVKSKKNGYDKPKAIPKGEVLTDISKKGWKIGPSIGAGGFGDIYSACKADISPKKPDDYNYVVKIEPHENGPLFVEMHFYMRNAKLEDINEFCKNKGLKSLGMPYLIGSGSHEINGVKHRFIVMPRYGKDIWSLYLANNRKLPEHTIYRLAIQMLDVYEYIHGCTYVHADLKGANILLGFGKSGTAQAYLVDFGLASHYTTKDFKPDPKKRHNGTMEYTSRDAHNGVPTMRGDLEILAYNLVNWAGAALPWEAYNILSNPSKVQSEKEEFMKNPDKSLGKLSQNISVPIREFFKYLITLKHNDVPDYEKCRKIFQNGLKSLGKSNSGELDFKVGKAESPLKARLKRSSDDFEDKPVKVKKMMNNEVPSTSKSPQKRQRAGTHKVETSDKKRIHSSPAPKKKAKINSNILSSDDEDKISEKSVLKSTSVNKTKAGGNAMPKSHGQTIINENIDWNPRNNKIYEVNFELDVSVDANIIVNVNRKKKSKTDAKEQDDDDIGTPVVRIKKLVNKNIPEKASPRRRGRSAK